MGLGDFLGDVFFKVGMIVDTGKSFVELGKNSAEEFTEIVNEGKEKFYYEVIKNEDGYQSSYEKRDKASSIIGNCKVNLQEHCNILNKRIEKLNKNVKDITEKKRTLAYRLNVMFNDKTDKFGKVIREVERPYFDYMEVPLDFGRLIPVINRSAYTFNAFQAFGFANPASLIAMPLLNGIAMNARIEAANEYYEAALDYEIKVKKKIKELDAIHAIIQHVEFVLEEEEHVIKSLLNTTVSKEEITDYAKQLRVLMSEMVLSENGTLNIDYKNAVAVLKRHIN